MTGIIRLSASEIKGNALRFTLIFICVMLAVIPIVMVYTYLGAFAEIQYWINVNELLSASKATSTSVRSLAKNETYYFLKVICLFFTSAVSLVAFISIKNVILNEYSKRVKTLGLLDSQGASLLQKALYLSFSGLLLSVFAVPCGIIAGYALIIPIVKAQSALCSEYLGIPPLSALDGAKASDLIVLIICTVAVIILSTFQPAFSTIKKTTVELTKMNSAINISLKESLIDKLITNRFGILGKLACCNFTNNKKQHLHFSLTVSSIISLFMMIQLFGNYLKQEVTFEKRGLEELNNGTVKIAMILLLAVFLVVFMGVLSSLFVTFDKRKPEFAILKFIGISENQLARVILLESIYQNVYTFVFSVFGTLLGDLILFKLVSDNWSNVSFVFPLFETVIIIIAVCVLIAIMSGIMFLMFRKASIISELKKILW